jgi:hypothetical protein
MFKLAEYLPPFPNATWTLARQAGVTHAVSQVPPDDVDGPEARQRLATRLPVRREDDANRRDGNLNGPAGPGRVCPPDW